jgi:phosphomannomutase
MSEAPLMLGVSGLRGIVGKSLTPEVAARFAGAFGAWLRTHGKKLDRPTSWKQGVSRPLVVLGADGRAGFEAIRDAAASGLRGAGCTVVDIGVAMTPTVGVAVDHEDADAGMIVTASHNPQEWNGLKCLVRDAVGGIGGGHVSAAAPSAAAANEIIALFKEGKPTKGSGSLMAISGDSVGMHLGPVLSAMGALADVVRAAKFRVLLDSVNGSGRVGGRKLLDALQATTSHVGAEDTGVFPHVPEPTKENLSELCQLTKSHQAVVGFAQDPDADRLAIVDERGEYIGEEYTLVLAAEALLGESTKRQGRTQERVLVTNLSTSRMIDDVAARHGAKVVRTPVGEANVVEVMKREAAEGREVVVGGEGNGGVIWPKVTYVRDSLSAMGLVLGLMARRKEKLSTIVASMPRYAIEKRKVELARKEDARPAVEKIAAAYRDERVDLQDGVRVDFEAKRAWLHVRASNTEPIMRLIAEAPTEADARGVLEEAERVIGG